MHPLWCFPFISLSVFVCKCLPIFCLLLASAASTGSCPLLLLLLAESAAVRSLLPILLLLLASGVILLQLAHVGFPFLLVSLGLKAKSSVGLELQVCCVCDRSFSFAARLIVTYRTSSVLVTPPLRHAEALLRCGVLERREMSNRGPGGGGSRPLPFWLRGDGILMGAAS